SPRHSPSQRAPALSSQVPLQVPLQVPPARTLHSPVQLPPSSMLPMQSPSHAALPSSSHVPWHSPSHEAPADMPHEPWQVPSHWNDGAVPGHLSRASPSHDTMAEASASQVPWHLTSALPPFTDASQRADASMVASAETSQRGGWYSMEMPPSMLP